MMIESQSTVYILDSDTVLLQRLARLLASVGLPVQTCQTPDEFLIQHGEDCAGCLLLGVRLSRTSGLTLYRRLREDGDLMPVIFLATDPDVETAVEAMREGAFDFLQIPVRDQYLLDRVDAALQKERRDRQRRSEQWASAARFQELSPKEREVLDLMMSGRSSKALARELGVSCKTLSFHRSNIMRKVEVETVAELAYLYFVGGLHVALPPRDPGHGDDSPGERLVPCAWGPVKPLRAFATCHDL